MFRYALLFVLVGCASSAPLDSGPEGAVGPQGPAGEMGPVGPQGAPGPKGDVGPQGPAGLSAVKAGALPPGSLCATGGLLLTDADGGTAVLCNGTKGDTGAVGAQGLQGQQGIQGPVGPQGAYSKALTVRDQDGGVVGSVYPSGGNSVDFVYREGPECVGVMDFSRNVITGLQTSVWYTGYNCTGIPVVRMNLDNLFPVGCLQVGEQGFKVRQPVVVQQVTAVSFASKVPVMADGGTTTCLNVLSATYAYAVVDPVSLTDVAGPFYFGNR